MQKDKRIRGQLGKIRDVPRLASAIGALYPVSPDLQGPEHWRRVWASDLAPED